MDVETANYHLSITTYDKKDDFYTAILAVGVAPKWDAFIESFPEAERAEKKFGIGYGKELSVWRLSGNEKANYDDLPPVPSEAVCEAFKGSIDAVLTGKLTPAEAGKLETAKKLIEQSAAGGYSAAEIKAIVGAFDAAKQEGLKGL